MTAKVFETAFSTYTAIGAPKQGGSGEVYQVKDDQDNTFALKRIIPGNVSSEKVKRFKNELLFCMRFDHRNIIKIIDYGYALNKDIKCPFYVMKYYAETLRDLMARKIDSDKILPYFSQILDGVEEAHLRGVFHRDIKPENILYDKEDDILIISDFGIAHFSEEFLVANNIETDPHERLANFQYAAPEQRMRNRRVDHRADIFALGLILNEMFTGEILQGTGYRKIESVLKEYSYLDNIVDNMVRQLPEKRFESIDKIKQKLIGLKVEFVSRQRLNKLRNTVVPETEIDDPILLNPIQLMAPIDYKGDLLTLRLTNTPNDEWVRCFYEVRINGMLVGFGPQNFQFINKTAVIGASEELVQRVVDDFKKYLKLASKSYEDLKISEHRAFIESERQRLISEAEAEEKRLRIIKNTSI